MSPDEPERNILFFFSFSRFFRVDRGQRERGGWWMSEKGRKGVAKKATHERKREREERREKGWMEEGRDVSFALNLENHAQPHFPRERPLPAPRRCTRTVFYPFAARFKPRQPFLRPPIYNSPAMRRSRTKDERKIPWWETLTQICRGISAHANCYGEIAYAMRNRAQPWLSSLPFLSFFSNNCTYPIVHLFEELTGDLLEKTRLPWEKIRSGTLTWYVTELGSEQLPDKANTAKDLTVILEKYYRDFEIHKLRIY